MCYLEGGIQGRKEKEMWKVAQVWDSSDFQTTKEKMHHCTEFSILPNNILYP